MLCLAYCKMTLMTLSYDYEDIDSISAHEFVSLETAPEGSNYKPRLDIEGRKSASGYS